jgi:hypothetical protein
MKVHKIYAYFAENDTTYEEQFFTFGFGESEKYFADAGGDWAHSFWFTKRKGDSFSTDDLACWVDRIPGCELKVEDCDRLTRNMLSDRFTLAANLNKGESVSYIKHERYNVYVACVYDGSVEDCPEEFQFDLDRSEKEV